MGRHSRTDDDPDNQDEVTLEDQTERLDGDFRA